jgi:predicted nicotinamide N-methyase
MSTGVRKQGLRLQGKRVLELGAGSGVMSLVCAMRGASSVVVTDVAGAVGGITRTLALNCGALGEVEVTVMALPWGGVLPAVLHGAGKPDLVIGSDLLYNVKDQKALLATIEALAPPSVLLAVRWRKPEEERAFFQCMQRRFDISLLHGPEVRLYALAVMPYLSERLAHVERSSVRM